jgi:hypothetical protein
LRVRGDHPTAVSPVKTRWRVWVDRAESQPASTWDARSAEAAADEGSLVVHPVPRLLKMPAGSGPDAAPVVDNSNGTGSRLNGLAPRDGEPKADPNEEHGDKGR